LRFPLSPKEAREKQFLVSVMCPPDWIARTPVVGVRSSPFAKAANLKDRGLLSSSGARVWGRTGDLKGGGLR
jgi:hypothetical protein